MCGDKTDVEMAFLAWAHCGLCEFKANGFTFAGGRFEDGEFAFLDGSSVYTKFIVAAQPAQVGEVLFVVYSEGARFQIFGFDDDGLDEVFEFIHGRMGRAVGPDEAVDAEVVVVGMVVKVAAISPMGLAIVGGLS